MSGLWSDLPDWEWRGPTSQQGGAMTQQRGMVVHIAEGSYEGTISWQKHEGTNVSSHFVVAGPGDAHDGRIAQVVPVDVTAWTQQQGNGKWLSAENSGFSPNGLSAKQLEANAQLYARGMREFAWPAKLATSPSDRGLAFHGLACVTVAGQKAPWTLPNTSGETWGHCECPGSGIIAQLPAILARAVEINGGEADDMNAVHLFAYDADGNVWMGDGQTRRIIGTRSVSGGKVSYSSAVDWVGNWWGQRAGATLDAKAQGAPADQTTARNLFIPGPWSAELDGILGVVPATGGGGPVLVDHKHPVSLTVSGSSSGSGTGQTGSATPIAG